MCFTFYNSSKLKLYKILSFRIIIEITVNHKDNDLTIEEL